MILDPKHPFYAPFWRRIAIVGVCLGWGLFELTLSNPIWGALFIGLGLWVAWMFWRTPPEGGSGGPRA